MALAAIIAITTGAGALLAQNTEKKPANGEALNALFFDAKPTTAKQFDALVAKYDSEYKWQDGMAGYSALVPFSASTGHADAPWYAWVAASRTADRTLADARGNPVSTLGNAFAALTGVFETLHGEDFANELRVYLMGKGEKPDFSKIEKPETPAIFRDVYQAPQQRLDKAGTDRRNRKTRARFKEAARQEIASVYRMPEWGVFNLEIARAFLTETADPQNAVNREDFEKRHFGKPLFD